MKKILKKFPDYYLIFCIYALIGWLYEVIWLWFVVPPYHFVNRGVLFGPFLPIYGFGMLILIFMLDKFMNKKHQINQPIYLIISVLTAVTFIFVTIIEYTTPRIYHVGDFLSKYGVGLFITNLLVLSIVYFILKNTKSKKIRKLDVTIILVFLLIWVITTVIEYASHFMTDKLFHTMLWDYSRDFLNVNKRINWDASRNFAIGGTVLLYTVQPFIEKLLRNLSKNRKLYITLIIGIPMLIDLIVNVISKYIGLL
ncbi:MAG: putative ABC transporter permease [Bacilli bacterium]|nr:putative ABC transporter permease [Bacilli bacterium]